MVILYFCIFAYKYTLNIFIFRCKITNIDTVNTKYIIRNQSCIDDPKGLYIRYLYYIRAIYKNYYIININLHILTKKLNANEFILC